MALSARSDAYLVRIESGAVSAPRAGNAATAKAEASRVRLVLDGSRRFAIGPGRALTPSFEAGLRHDGGDGASGTGAELGAALRYEVSGRALAVRLLGCAGECGGHRRWHASLFMHRDTGAEWRARAVAVIVLGCHLGRQGKAGTLDRNPVRPSLRRRRAGAGPIILALVRREAVG